MLRRLLVLLTSLALILCTPLTSLAGSWQLDSYGWWWLEDNGSYPVSSWKYIDDNWYYFNSVGYMKTGWVLDDGLWYYLENSGAMRYAPLTEKGLIYYFNESGACINPEGKPVVVNTMSEAEYLDETSFWLRKVGYINSYMDGWDNALNLGAYQTVITESSSHYDSLWYWFDIIPPETYTEIHDDYQYANSNMISALETYHELAVSLQDGSLDSGDINRYLEYTDEYISIAAYHIGIATEKRQNLN